MVNNVICQMQMSSDFRKSVNACIARARNLLNINLKRNVRRDAYVAILVQKQREIAMHREREYQQLANDMFRRASNEESAQLVSQWKILGARYLELARQSPETGEKDALYDPVQSELLKHH